MPIGVTVNMNGTALYNAAACIFIAQVKQVDLSAAQVVQLGILAAVTSAAAAGVPQSGLIPLGTVLNTVGLPKKDIALILSVDWLLDR